MGVVLFEADSQCNIYAFYLLTPLMTNGESYLCLLGAFNQIVYISVLTGRAYYALMTTGKETTLQITKKNEDIRVCEGGKILFTFLALFIGRTQGFLRRSRMGKWQCPLESIKLPFKLQRDVSMSKSYKQRGRVQPCGIWHHKYPTRTSLWAMHTHGEADLQPTCLRAGATFLCFPQVQDSPSTSLYYPAL